MIKIFSLAAGLATGALCSQVPEFSQQYLQRLGGQVDALTAVVLDFDASALASGLGREEALAQLSGAAFLDARQVDMRATFARHARLSDHLLTLRAATPMQRMMMPHRMTDVATFQATWADFTPALPISTAGAVATGSGFIGGWALVGAVLSLIALPFRRGQRNVAPKQTHARIKADPPVARPTPPVAAKSHIRPLAGAKR
ncbi:Protein of unknown function [Yoonia tamlensis]|uniref:DUF2937 family protein n=1 Tax=Yoonia tamlensis TaxID=390270 RepID=A0A1I6FXH9_9RHOB|nr:DUF2937 family protein [Yoonia tamlensis]SFR34655.1 Protein of unknown function [Yoonia tamlensis]